MPRIDYNYEGSKVKILMELRIQEAEDMADLTLRNAERELERQRSRGVPERNARSGIIRDFDNGEGIFRDLERQIDGMVDELYKDAVSQPVDHYAEQNQKQLFIWKLGKVITDHCPDCRYLSTLPARNIKSWKAISIGGRKVGLPREGRTKCSYGCKCLLRPVGEKEAPVQEAKIKKEKGTKGIPKDQLSPGMVGKHTTVAEAEAWATHNIKNYSKPSGKPYPVAFDYSMLNDPDMANNFNKQLKILYKDFPINDLGSVSVSSMRQNWYGYNRGGKELVVNHKFANDNRKGSDVSYNNSIARRYHPENKDQGKGGFRASVVSHEFGHTLSWKYIRRGYWASATPPWAEGMHSKLSKLQRRYNKEVRAFNKRWGDPNIHNYKTQLNEPGIINILKGAGKDVNNMYYMPQSHKWHKKNHSRKGDYYDQYQRIPTNKAFLNQKEVNAYVKERDGFYVSGYASKNLDEFISESIAMYYNGKHVSPIAKEVFNVLKHHYDKRKKEAKI
mgnify:CR=1 FL=1